MLFLPIQIYENMLTSIEIQNFRTFQKLNVNGFKAVNLFGGTNNSGKTALLEALFLSIFPGSSSIFLVRNIRGEDDKVLKGNGKRVWNYLFFNQNKANGIIINSSFNDDSQSHIKIFLSENVQEILNSISNNKTENFYEFLKSKFSETEVLHVIGKQRNANFDFFLVPDTEEGKIGIVGNVLKGFDSAPFLPSQFRLDDKELASLYSNSKENKKLNYLNDILKLIDERIVGTEIDAPGGKPVIQINLNNDQSFPISLFGDAVRKVTEIILVLLNSSNKVIFIDEIENGIHFTKHKFLWKILFEISKSMDCQIFATSHSAEMISSFNQVAIEEKFEDRASYFEMSRLPDGVVIASRMDTEMLNYEILTNSSYRGE